MKNLRLILLFALLIAAYFSPAFSLTLKIATVAPAGSSWMQEMTIGAKAIAERTDNRVKLKFYPGGVMGNDQSIHRKIRINQLQGGAFSSSGLTQVNTAIQLLSLPMVFQSFDEVDQIRAIMDDVIKQRMEQSGFVILGITEAGFAQIFSSQPIDSLDAMRASKVWVPEGDKLVETTFNTLGVKPVALPLSDVFTGLQTGLIDTISSTASGAIAFQWHTKLNYMIDLPVIYIIAVLAVNKSAFDKISDADQLVVKEEMNKVSSILNAMARKDDSEARQALEKQGIQFIDIPAQEIQNIKTLSSESIQIMVNQGDIDKQLIETMLAHLQKLRSN